MATYILLWNPDKWYWPDKDYEAVVERTRIGQMVDGRWSCGNRKTVELDSRFFLFRAGVNRGVIGSGFAKSEPSRERHWDKSKKGTKANYIKVQFDQLLPKDDVLEAETLVREVAGFTWHKVQCSGLELPQKLEDRLETLWQRHLRTLGRACSITHVRRKVWRMAMRAGSQGPSVFEKCRKKNVAAICYRQLDGIDLREYPRDEPKRLWNKLPNACKGFLRRVAYDMKKGDTIYVKEGEWIVARGTVLGPYKYDRKCSILVPGGTLMFAHQRPVAWETDFQPVHITLGAEQSTVLELKGPRLQRLEAAVGAVNFQLPDEITDREVLTEGNAKTVTVNQYERSPKARARCIEYYTPTCNVCGFEFGKFYGDLGESYIHVHHLAELAAVDGEYEVDPIKDLRPVCPNCHAMLHLQTPAMSIEALRKIVRKNRLRHRM